MRSQHWLIDWFYHHWLERNRINNNLHNCISEYSLRIKFGTENFIVIGLCVFHFRYWYKYANTDFKIMLIQIYWYTCLCKYAYILGTDTNILCLYRNWQKYAYIQKLIQICLYRNWYKYAYTDDTTMLIQKLIQICLYRYCYKYAHTDTDTNNAYADTDTNMLLHNTNMLIQDTDMPIQDTDMPIQKLITICLYRYW